MPNEKAIDTSMINVSSNVLFHFTDKREYLLNILRKNFSARYCPEYGPHEGVEESHPVPPKYARPMVCFCDLPLFLIKNHLKRYGPYGIGLKKEWGIKNGISSVLYAHRYANTLTTMIRVSVLGSNRVQSSEEYMEFRSAIEWLIGLVKPYEGPWWRHGEYKGTVRFYDEREWRFAPYFDNAAIQIPAQLEYVRDMDLEINDVRIRRRYLLEFVPEDIEYVILDNEDEIVDMVEMVRQIKGRYDESVVTKLTTKIITAKRILEDM